MLAASPNAPAFDGDLKAFAMGAAARTEGGQRSLSQRQERAVAAFRRADRRAAIRRRAGSAQVGRVVGVKPVADELYGRLAQPGETTQSGRSVLVQVKDNKLTYLSPITDPQHPIQPLSSPFGIDATDRDVVFAAQNPGGFATDKQDYQGRAGAGDLARPLGGALDPGLHRELRRGFGRRGSAVPDLDARCCS